MYMWPFVCLCNLTNQWPNKEFSNQDINVVLHLIPDNWSLQVALFGHTKNLRNDAGWRRKTKRNQVWQAQFLETAHVERRYLVNYWWYKDKDKSKRLILAVVHKTDKGWSISPVLILKCEGNVLHNINTSTIFWPYSGCIIEKDVKYTWNSPSREGAKTYYDAKNAQVCATVGLVKAFELRGKGSGSPQFLWNFNPTSKTQRCSAFDAKLKTGKTKAQGYLSGNSKCAELPKSGCLLGSRWICRFRGCWGILPIS